MIRRCKDCNEEAAAIGKLNYRPASIQGGFVGLVTGLIGAGGGFLIIPALVNLLKLPIKVAIGTSLLIISSNSLAGFFFHFITPT